MRLELDVENCLKKTNLFSSLNSFQLSRNLKKLKIRKPISLKDNRVTILNPEGLRKLSEHL